MVAVNGDITRPEFDIAHEDMQRLREQVHVVFHCAASIKFDDPLQYAMQINYCGTKTLLNICKGFMHLEALVFVSTCYAHYQLRVVEERVYPLTKASGDDILAAMKWIDSNTVEQLAKKFLFDGRPNTYTFTKALAEDYINRHSDGMPVAIARLSIVLGAVREPALGYTDSLSTNSFEMIAEGDMRQNGRPKCRR